MSKRGRSAAAAVPSWWLGADDEQEHLPSSPVPATANTARLESAGWDAPSRRGRAADESTRLGPTWADPRESAGAEPDAAGELGELDTDAEAVALPGAEPDPELLSGPVRLPRASHEEIHDAAAAQFAACFAVDCLSWDEANPTRRDAALRRYLPAGSVPFSWSGRGRQRATLAIPGRAERRVECPGVVWVEVQALVTPYRRLSSHIAPGRTQQPGASAVSGRPSAAPAPEANGWQPEDSEWVSLDVPVRRQHSGRLVIDELATAGPDQLEVTSPDHIDSRGA
jgi:hypothetical protein